MFVAIHQPTFFPWLGLFRKIARADIFVFLDAVPFPRTSRGNWVNRVKLLKNGEPRWFTCPVSRQESDPLIRDLRMAKSTAWRDNLRKTLAHHYGRHASAAEVLPLVQNLIDQDNWGSL